MNANQLANPIVVFSVIVATSGTGQAAVVGTATLKANPPAVPFASPDAALGSPWVSYVLNLQTTAGELIGGIDVDIQATLHQRWVYDSMNGISNPTANSSNQTNGDSHLMSTGNFGFNDPNEDNSGNGSPLADTATANYGLGTYLRGTWGVPSPPTSTNFAYLVVPNNLLYEIDIEVNVANPSGAIIGRLTERDFFPNVPEPTSGALLGFGIFGFSWLARRRGR